MTESDNQPSSTPPAAPAQSPSVGRIVHVFCATEDGKLESHAAMVTAVHGPNCVNLTVFPPSGGTHSMTSVDLGTASGQWTWPPRV